MARRPRSRRSAPCWRAPAPMTVSAARSSTTAHQPDDGPGEGYQPQNLKRPEVEDLDAAIAAVMTGDYALMKQLYPKPLSVVGDCSRAMITAADDHELIGADLSCDRKPRGGLGGRRGMEARRLSQVRRDRRSARRALLHDRSARSSACLDGTYTRTRPNAKSARPAIWLLTMRAASVRGGILSLTGSATKRSRRSSRSGARRIRRSCGSGTGSTRAAVRAVYEPGVEIVCGPVVLKSDGEVPADPAAERPRSLLSQSSPDCRRSRQRPGRV